MGNIEYRTATLEDVDIFIEFQKESGAYHEELDSRFRYAYAPNVDGTRKAFFTKQCDSDKSWIGLAIKDGELVGYIKANIQERPPVFLMRTIGFLEDLYVTATARGQGIGTISGIWH